MVTLIERPRDAWLGYVLGHGAGAGMRHPFLAAVVERLAGHGIATLRYEFLYMAEGRKRPDSPEVAEGTVREAVNEAREQLQGLPLIAGGKSFGGRMTSQAQAGEPLPGVVGLVFLGFPLHPPRRPSISRSEHLSRVRIPMLFLQGTRDDLADLALIREVCSRLGSATLYVVEGGDHSFNVLKRSGRTKEQVLSDLAGAIARWAREVVGRSSGGSLPGR